MNYDLLIYSIAKKRGLPDSFCRNLVAQARHETNDYKSPLFLKYKNAFGYGFVNGGKWQSGKTPKVNKVGEPVYFAAYKTVSDSVNELLDYWARRKKENDFSDYSQLNDSAVYSEILKANGFYTATYNAYKNSLKSKLSKINLTPESGKNGSSVGYVILTLIFFAVMVKFNS